MSELFIHNLLIPHIEPLDVFIRQIKTQLNVVLQSGHNVLRHGLHLLCIVISEEFNLISELCVYLRFEYFPQFVVKQVKPFGRATDIVEDFHVARTVRPKSHNETQAVLFYGKGV